MDITRIPEPTEKDHARLERYQKEHKTLIEALHNSTDPTRPQLIKRKTRTL